MGSNPQTTESTTISKKDTNSGQVQLASHEVTADSSNQTGESDRIRRLEAMVQQLLEQKSNSIASPASSNSARGEVIRLKSDDSQDDDRLSTDRLKLTGRSRLRQSDGESEQIEPRRRAHPLDDEAPSPRQSSYENKRVHPLESVDEAAEEAASLPRNAVQNQQNRRSSR